MFTSKNTKLTNQSDAKLLPGDGCADLKKNPRRNIATKCDKLSAASKIDIYSVCFCLVSFGFCTFSYYVGYD